MAALSNFTGLTGAEEIVPTEEIPNFILGYQYPARSGLLVAWSQAGKGNIPFRFPRWNQITPTAGNKSETDVFTDQSVTTTESSITPGIVGDRYPVSDELMKEAVSGIPMGLLQEALNALANRMDSDILASSTSATNIAGTTSDVFTYTKFNDALSTYRALNAPVGPAGVGLILDDTPLKTLLDDLANSAAVMVPTLADAQLFGPASGFKGRLSGVSLFHNSNVAAEGAGRSNVLTAIGAGVSGLGAVMNEMPNVRMTRGDDAELRATTYWVVRAWYGAGITDPAKIVEVRTQA